jgi:hypothetical protein
VVRHITKSDKRPHNLRWHYHVGTLLWSDCVPLHWTFKWGRNCSRPLPAGQCHCTHSSCFHDAALPYVRGQNSFKGHSATTAARSYTPKCCLWGAMKGAVYKDSPHSHSPWTEEAIALFIRTSFWLNFRVSLQTRRIDACLQAHGGDFQHLSYNKYEKYRGWTK